MHVVRRLLAQRQLAALICAGALLLKLLVPTGYMIDNSHDGIRITICSGTAPSDLTMEPPAMHGDMPHHGTSKDHGKPKDHGKAEMPCAFSGLSAAALGAIDPIQLVTLIAFVMGAGLVAVRLPRLTRPAHLRPPPRGPPTYL